MAGDPYAGEYMKDNQKLILIKVVHTIIWVFFVTVIFYVVYSGITDTVNLLTWMAIAAVVVEGLVLLLFSMYCPLTLVARKYSDSNLPNFDIYLPQWLAKYNKVIFTSIFSMGVILVIIRVIQHSV